MIKLCDETRGKALCLIYNDCIKTGVFPNIWKKSLFHPVKEEINILFVIIDLLPSSYLWSNPWNNSTQINKKISTKKIIFCLNINFSKKKVNNAISLGFFNNTVVEQLTWQKYLGIYLHEKVDFNTQIKRKLVKPIEGLD